MKSCLIIISGLPGSGKSEAASYFVKQGIPIVRMGKITDNILKLQRASGESSEKVVREDLRKKLGRDIYAKKVSKETENKLKKHSIVIIEGLRNIEELQFFQNVFTLIKVIFITVEKKVRFARLKCRKIRPLDQKEARLRDQSELYTLGLADIEKTADYIVNNTGTLHQFYRKLDDILSDIKQSV